jgi:predicted lysophospholipase L1 biosynthesis ABC-type transport system permease subunit
MNKTIKGQIILLILFIMLVILVTENPDYIRKDLPKHVPQFFLVSLTWQDWEPLKKFAEIVEQNFPFEKLQAMIDK